MVYVAEVADRELSAVGFDLPLALIHWHLSSARHGCIGREVDRNILGQEGGHAKKVTQLFSQLVAVSHVALGGGHVRR